MSMHEINEIRSQIGTLKDKLLSAKKRLSQACMDHNNIAVGDRVVVKNRCGEFEVSITGWEPEWGGSGRPKGTKVKRDGTVGNQSAGYITNWEKVTR